jgi:hypothetical protein
VGAIFGEVWRDVSTTVVAGIIFFGGFRGIHHWAYPKRLRQFFGTVKIGKTVTVTGPRLQREDCKEKIGGKLGIEPEILRQVLLQCFQLVIIFIFQIKRLGILVLLGAPVVPLINQNSKDHNKFKVFDHKPIYDIH